MSTPAHALWSSRLMFILAATGSAVGLGNIWKFPYITGEYGGGAFVLMYLLCVAVIGLPILIAEILIGRRGGKSPIGSMAAAAAEAGRSRAWAGVGWLGVVSAFLILSFYSVVAGWALTYIGYAASGRFSAAATAPEGVGEAIGALFSSLLADPGTLILWHTVFMAVTIFIVARGVRRGLEGAVRILMPGLFVLLLGLVAYAALSSGAFGQALEFLFRPQFERLSGQAVLVAMGHAFFSLSLGLGAMMAYGSYLPAHVSIGRAAIAIALLDTGVALLAGLAIFPLVFANELAPGAGPGLIFVSLPVAFAQMPGGTVVGLLFFVFLFIAALTSAISLLEPPVEYVAERWGSSRPWVALGLGGAIWLLGIASALAFNAWSGFTLFGKNVFDLLDFTTTNIMLPLGGLLIALFAGWKLSGVAAREGLALPAGGAFALWQFAVRYLAPLGVALVLVFGLL